MSTIVFISALLLITVFMAWLYRNFQWENKEQQYLELMAKKNRFEKAEKDRITGAQDRNTNNINTADWKE
ncbi:MAG: hypothetical protein H7068_10310 [Pedobacter sp.]|nr:hypothetical protein [Chitinophagaceae bacterium]